LRRDSIRDAEAKVAALQEALDEAQRVLQFAEQAQDTVERHATLIRMLGVALIGGVIVAILAMVTGRRRARSAAHPPAVSGA
jgi:hypothetical protein